MKILSREDFITEVYNPMMEEKKYKELQSLNEGLLKNLFGKIKNIFTNDWKKIKGDESIKKIYKDFDDKLTGFSTMKMNKREQCNKIRQELVDFACMWYDHKKTLAKKNDSDPSPAKSLKFKDSTLKESLEKCQKVINDITDGDVQMQKWAQLLMDDMKIVINQVIINEIDDEDAKKRIQEETEESQKKQDEVNKKMEEFQNKQLEMISKEREKFLTDSGCKLLKENITGDKTVKNICNEFKKLLNASKELYKINEGKESPEITAKKEEILKVLSNDTTLGFKTIFEGTKKITKTKFEPTFRMMNAFYTALGANDVIKKFEDVPSQSVQAMCVSINSFIKNSIYGTDATNQIPLMAKCAIVSNGIVSYNLPTNDKGDGNYYTDIMGMIVNGDFNKNDKSIKLPDDFKQNASDLMKKIISEAKKLKKESEKQYENQMKKFKLE